MNLIPFQFEQKAVRTVVIDGEPYFVAREVAQILGYAKPENAIAAHCKATLKQGIPTPGGVQQMTLIPERDVYRLVMKSKLPGAERFEEWVVGEVLPAIRKTGKFIADTAKALADPAALRTLLLGYTEKVIELEGKVAEQAPKVAALDRLATVSDGSCSLTEAAKSVGMKPKAFMEWMRARRWIYRHPLNSTWLGYQPRLDAGTLEHKVVTYEGSDGERVKTQVRVTAKGLARIAELIEKEKDAVPA